MKGLTMLLFCFSLLSIFTVSSAIDTIAATQSIRDGNTIVSAGGIFELGFFRPDNSKYRYLGIWYKISTSTRVWVANRNVPLNDSSNVLKFNDQGILVILNSTNSTIWSSNSPRVAQNPVAQLLDTGNLVLREANDDNLENSLWQSFDHIGNTFLPGMKFGRDLVTGLDRYLTSWKSVDDPSPGDYTNRIDPSGYPQIMLRRGSDITYRSGPWNGLHFSGMPNLKPNQIYTFQFVISKEEIYYKYELADRSVYTMMVLSQDGVLQRFTWSDRSQSWSLYLTAQMDNCDRYALCGTYGSCNINNSPACGCLRGFVPKYQEDWQTGDWSNGCVRKTELECGKGEGFQIVRSVKLPDTRKSWYNSTMDLTECERVCEMNCSCTAYANLDIRGTGCLLWFGDLIDIRQYAENGQDLYIRLAASDLDTSSSSKRKKQVKAIVIPILVLAMLLLGVWLILRAVKKKKLRREGVMVQNQERDYSYNDESRDKDLELPLFDLATVINATNDFSNNNKIGEGGYGPVYKGTLMDGQEIAVKRLSKKSRQGLDEFKNEVLSIAKLQHRNLVRLLGCCIEVEEKMLIYEYMPNRSLDSFIFALWINMEETLADQSRSTVLNWPRRFHIVNGIARGLLYLHQDSRLRIIHRDLKASNILLDHEMNPKISDFGMARSFQENETEANTKRVVGTYGYMSPEYAIDGLFSVKSDVFSFGVLVLEIISGRRNRGFSHPDHNHNLVGHAWRLYKEGRSLELIDESIKGSCIISEVIRSIHVGLLCVQQSPEDRPNMANVVLMLTSDIALPDPKEPGFFTERNLFDTDSSLSKVDTCSANQMSITLLTAR